MTCINYGKERGNIRYLLPILVLLFFFLSVQESSGQAQKISFERINTSSGLSNNRINFVYQDRRGYLWISTQDGLNRYDGYTFRTYRHDAQDSTSIAANVVYPIVEDSAGTLWIGTKDGLSRYNPDTDSFRTWTYNDQPLPNPQADVWRNAVIGLYADQHGNIWLGTVFNGLGRFNIKDQSFEFFILDSLNRDGVNSNAVFNIIPDIKSSGSKLWLGGWASGLLQFDIPTGQFTRYRHDPQDNNSLSGDNIRSLYQESDGTLWIGTEQAGLNKFIAPGRKFIRFQHQPANPASLSNNTIPAIYQDQKNPDLLWLGTSGGLNIFNKKTGTSRAIHSDINDETTLSSDLIFEIYRDRSGVIWVGGGGGLNKIDPGRVPFRQYSTGQGLNSNQVLAMVKSIAQDAVLWIGTYQGGLNKIDAKDKTVTYFKSNPNQPTSINSDSVTSLYEDPDEAGEVLWVGTFRGGLNRFDIKQGRFKNYTYNPADEQSISSNWVRAIYETRDGMLWLTTPGGLNRFDRQKEIFTRYLLQDTAYVEPIMNLLQQLDDTHKSISKILQVQDDETRSQTFNLPRQTTVLLVSLGEGVGQMWDYGWLEDSSKKTIWKMDFAASRHAGGNIKNRIHIAPLTLPPGQYTLHYKSDDSHSYNLWNAPAPKNAKWWGVQVFELSVDQSRFVSRNIDKFEKPNSIVSGNTTAILEDSYGMLWIGSVDQGLSKFDRKTRQFTNYQMDASQPGSLSSNQIMALFEDRKGFIWIGTADGLNRYDPKTNAFKSWSVKDGLPNNVILSIVDDLDGNLWLATNNGIAKCNPDELARHDLLTFINYNIQDGLQYNPFYYGSSFRSGDGELFFGGRNGMVSFYPPKPNPEPPRTLISNFLLFNQRVVPGPRSLLKKDISESSQINLSYKQNVFAFEFTAINYSNTKKSKYLYKMEGFDQDWIDGSRRYAPYTNLDPGAYTFRVKAASSDGVWDDDGATVHIVIAPPWWQTVPAYITYGVLLLMLIFGFDRLQRRRLLARTKERMKIQAAEHRAEAAELQARAVQAENERKSKELEEARELQLSMLPRSLPQLPHLDIAVYMKTATEVGGDYYDFHVAMDGTLTVVIGDATGHGMKAGTMVTTAKSLFNSYAPNPDIQFSFQEITRCIKQMNMDKMSMCMTMLKIQGDKLIMSSAGMPPSFIFRRQTRVVEEHLLQGMPLGTMEKFDYKIEDSPLEPGDTILLLSDGLPELQNQQQEMYGYKRVRNLFEEVAEKDAEDIINILKEDGSTWVNDQDPDDDVTFVVIKVK